MPSAERDTGGKLTYPRAQGQQDCPNNQVTGLSHPQCSLSTYSVPPLAQDWNPVANKTQVLPLRDRSHASSVSARLDRVT